MENATKCLLLFLCFFSSKLIAQESCIKGMGALSGYCGVYTGTIKEIADQALKCKFIVSRMQLELTPTGDFFLHAPSFHLTGQNYGPTDPNGFIHYIASLNSSGSLTPEIDLHRIECSPITDTNFKRDRCLNLQLKGNFSINAEIPSFVGEFKIEENENDYCHFSMDLIRQ